MEQVNKRPDIKDVDYSPYDFKVSQDYVFVSPKGLTEDLVRDISNRKNEPDWMLEMRLKAYREFINMPLPRWGPSLSGLDFDNIVFYAKPINGQARTWNDLPPSIKETFDRLGLPEAEKNFLAGVGAQFESDVVYHKIKKELEDQGVIFSDMDGALREYGDIVKKYYGTVIPIKDNKFAALTYAVWSGGSFVYVPKGVKIEKPLNAYFRLNAPDVGNFERTLIIAEEGSDVHYIEGCLPADELISKGDTLKPILLMEKGEEVVTESGRTATVTAKFIHRHQGTMITVVPLSTGNAFRLTPEHPILVIKREVVAEKEAELVQGAPQKLASMSPKYIEAGKLEEGDYIIYSTPMETQDDPSLTAPVLKAMGLYLANGSIGYEGKARVASFDFDKSERGRELAQELLDIAESIGGKARLHMNSDHYVVAIYSERLVGLLVNHGGVDAKGRALSKAVMKLPPEKQRLLLEYFLSCNGSGYPKDGESVIINASTASSTFAYQLQEILARNGIFVNIAEHPGLGDGVGKMVTGEGAYVIQYDGPGEVKKVGNHYLVPVKRLIREEYDDLVYNLEVEPENAYLVKGFVVHNCTAPVYSTSSLHSGVVEIVVKKDAHVRYTTIQNWSKNVYNLVTQRSHVEENGRMEWVDGNIGSKITMKYPSIYLRGKGARGEILSVAYANNQTIDSGGKIYHMAPDTSSKITSKGISKNGGSNIYRGLVYVARGATGVKSAVRCDALILDMKSKSDTYPYLNINENDATTVHEASVGKIGEEQMFYLRSRGLSEAEAQSMIVMGFLEPFTKELPLDFAVEMNRLIDLDMTGAIG